LAALDGSDPTLRARLYQELDIEGTDDPHGRIVVVQATAPTPTASSAASAARPTAPAAPTDPTNAAGPGEGDGCQCAVTLITLGQLGGEHRSAPTWPAFRWASGMVAQYAADYEAR
jgi:hypothetical protein